MAGFTAETTTEETTTEAAEAAPAEVPKLYKVKNIQKNPLSLENGSIAPGEEGVATLAEVCTLVGLIEELGAAE